MNKFFKVFGISFLCCIGIVCIAAVIFLKTTDFEQLTVRLTDFISQKIDKDVTIKNFGIAFRPAYGVTLDVNKLVIENNEASASTSLMEAERLSLGLDVFQLIRGKIAVTKAEIYNPVINIRTSELLALEGEAEKDKISNNGAGASSNVVNKNQEPVTKKTDTVSSLTMNSIKIINGQINYIDDLKEKGSVLVPLKDIDIKIDQFTFNDYFDFTVNARLWSNEENINVKGRGNIEDQSFKIKLQDLRLETNLHQWDLKEVMQSGVDIPFVLEEDLRGQVYFDLKDALLGENQPSFMGSLEVVDAKFKMEEFPFGFNNVDVRLDFTDSLLTLNELFFYVADGKVQAKSVIKNFLTNPSVESSFSVEDIDVFQIAKAFVLPVDFYGQLMGEGKINASGFSLIDEKVQLAGETKWEVVNGVLKNFNVLQIALSKISFIPDLQEKLKSRLSEEYQLKLKAKDTPFKKFVVYAKPSGQQFILDRTIIATEEFSLSLNGYVDLNQNAFLSGALTINQEFSKELLRSVSDLSYFLNKDGQIVIPFKPYQGNVSNAMLLPDIEKIGKTYIQEKGKQELRNVIFKALDVEQETVGGPDSELKGTQEKQKVSPESILINDIFNQIPLFN